MPKILFYKMTYDGGFAPNPFWGYLTLAACTPNHQRADLKKGDWLVGVESKSLSQQREKVGLKKNIKRALIYIACVDEVMDLTSYFFDKRFADKRYRRDKDWRKRRGDNVYYLDKKIWKWTRGHNHEPEGLKSSPNSEVFFPETRFAFLWRHQKARYGVILQDIRGNRVFISKKFSYFGDKCIEAPREFHPYIPDRGIKYCKKNDPNFDVLLNKIEELLNKYNGLVGEPINHRIKKIKNRGCATTKL